MAYEEYTKSINSIARTVLQTYICPKESGFAYYDSGDKGTTGIIEFKEIATYPTLNFKDKYNNQKINQAFDLACKAIARQEDQLLFDKVLKKCKKLSNEKFIMLQGEYALITPMGSWALEHPYCFSISGATPSSLLKPDCFLLFDKKNAGTMFFKHDIEVIPADNPQDLKIGWVCYEEIGVSIINDHCHIYMPENEDNPFTMQNDVVAQGIAAEMQTAVEEVEIYQEVINEHQYKYLVLD